MEYLKNSICNICLLTLILMLGSCGQTTKKNKSKEQKTANEQQGITNTKDLNIEIDGNLKDWPQVPFLTSLTAPWEEGKSDSTLFDYDSNDQYFYFYFNTVDTTITMVPFEEELSVTKGDRVELFFSATKDLSKDYYCIEINPRGELVDYKATYYRKFKEAWNFKSVELVAAETENGYLVEGKIALEELNSVGIEDTFYLGIFKADYKTLEEVTWYSWVVPDSKEPDFHIASAFKYFEKIVVD